MPSIKAKPRFSLVVLLGLLAACGGSLSEPGKLRERCVHATLVEAKARAEWEIAQRDLSPATQDAAGSAYAEAWSWKNDVCRAADMTANPYK
jgi:hypothetical protein